MEFKKDKKKWKNWIFDWICEWNQSFNAAAQLISSTPFLLSLRMGEEIESWMKGESIGRPERIENEAKQAKSLWIGWVSGGTAARQPANEEDEPPAAADWTMKRREQPSSTTKQQSNQMNLFIVDSFDGVAWWAELICLFFFRQLKWIYWRVMGGSSRTATSQERRERRKEDKWNQWSQERENNNSIHCEWNECSRKGRQIKRLMELMKLMESIVDWRCLLCCGMNETPHQGRQPPAASSSTNSPFFAAGHGKPAKKRMSCWVVFSLFN